MVQVYVEIDASVEYGNNNVAHDGCVFDGIVILFARAYLLCYDPHDDLATEDTLGWWHCMELTRSCYRVESSRDVHVMFSCALLSCMNVSFTNTTTTTTTSTLSAKKNGMPLVATKPWVVFQPRFHKVPRIVSEVLPRICSIETTFGP